MKTDTFYNLTWGNMGLAMEGMKGASPQGAKVCFFSGNETLTLSLGSPVGMKA